MAHEVGHRGYFAALPRPGEARVDAKTVVICRAFEGYEMSSAATTNSEPKLRVLQAGATAGPGGVTNANQDVVHEPSTLGP